MTNYPRDFIGYAANPPDPRWPGSARLAINFVVNYEEGGERSILHGDQTSETRLSDLATAVPIRNGRDLNMESAYEYGARVGAWRLLKLLQRDKQHGLAGTDVRAGFKDDAELIFAIAAPLPSRIVLELPKLFLGGTPSPLADHRTPGTSSR